MEADATEEFCRMEFFGVKKDGVEFVITIREYMTPPDPAMRFYATADKQTNQKSIPYTPVGWGPTLSTALWECVQAVRKFPYQP